MVFGAAEINEVVRLSENRELLLDMEQNLFTDKVPLVKAGPISQCP